MLAEIGAQDVPRLRVFNKIDNAGSGDTAVQAEREAALRAVYRDCIVMSARRSGDIALLREAIVGFFRQDQIEAEIFLPWSEQQRRNDIFASCEVLDERADGDGAFLRIRGEPAAVTSLCEQFGRA